MKIYAMSDIHGASEEFEYALSLVLPHLDEPDTMLILLGDYVDGYDDVGVLRCIIALQNKYGTDKVIALKGNHEEMFINESFMGQDYTNIPEKHFYDNWMENLPLYYVHNKTIFVHAGINEETEDMWEYETSEDTLLWKYPAQIGNFFEDYIIVAGHVGTSEIAENSHFHDIYYDGQSHYYIDGTVQESGIIPVIMVDTDTNQYYRVSEGGNWLILHYYEY